MLAAQALTTDRSMKPGLISDRGCHVRHHDGTTSRSRSTTAQAMRPDRSLPHCAVDSDSPVTEVLTLAPITRHVISVALVARIASATNMSFAISPSTRRASL